MARLGSARIRRLVVGVAIAVFVVPVGAVVAVEVIARRAHDELRERAVGAAGALGAGGEVAAVATRYAVDAWVVDVAARRVLATTEAMPHDETDLGAYVPSGGATFGSIAYGSAAFAAATHAAGRVEPWQREAVLRAHDHGASESCATVEESEVEGGLGGPGGSLWTCEAARRRPDGTVALVEVTAPRVASRLVDVRGPLLALAALVLLVGAVLMAWLVRRLTRPLDALHGRVRALAEIPRPAAIPPVGRSPREIAEVAAAVDSLVARLDAARAEQAEAAADLAHELKGPLARIKAMDLPAANAAVRAIDGIVVALLEIARVEAGLDDEPRADTDLAQLARDVAAARELTVEVRGAGRATVAAEAVARALGHLLDNARAFGTAVAVEVDDRTLVVIDDGPGVDPALAPRLFRRFASRRAGGTGLGLAYVRAVAEAHGGRATYERRGESTRFAIHI